MKRLFAVALLLLAVVPASTLAASTPEEATVNLYCRLKAGKAIYGVSGSGVFISERGVILTNAHVAQYFLMAGETGRVKGWCSVRTGSPAKETYTADVLYFPSVWLSENLEKMKEDRPSGTGENDFALLYVTGAKKGALPTSFPSLTLSTSTPAEGEVVTVLGYPTGSLDFSGIRNKLSAITASAAVENLTGFTVGGPRDVFTLASSSAAAHGVSGGPAITAKEMVAGIITSKSSANVRGITAAYVERSVKAQTGVSLQALLAENFTVRAALTDLLIPDQQVAELMKLLRGKSY